MYFGGDEDKCCEKTQMFGRAEGDYIMIMPAIKLKTILDPTIVFLFYFINNHCFSISCSQWHLSIAMHKSISAQFVILATCHYLYFHDIECSLVVVSPSYSCKKWSLVEEVLSNRPFEFHFDEKRVDIGSEVHISSRHKFFSSFRA